MPTTQDFIQSSDHLELIQLRLNRLTRLVELKAPKSFWTTNTAGLISRWNGSTAHFNIEMSPTQKNNLWR